VKDGWIEKRKMNESPEYLLRLRFLDKQWVDKHNVPINVCLIEAKKITYNSGDSPVVTHLTTNPPVSRLTRAERTGSRALEILWSYVKALVLVNNIH
jgi:hypothetical protein